MILWKCCSQYASKFGKSSSSHRTGRGQFSFQSQRKAMPNNAQTTAQLNSSHTLVKFSKPAFSNMWTMNFQMFKLDLEKAEEPEIKLLTSARSWKKAREFHENIYFCFLDYAKAFDCVDHNKLWKNLVLITKSNHGFQGASLCGPWLYYWPHILIFLFTHIWSGPFTNKQTHTFRSVCACVCVCVCVC